MRTIRLLAAALLLAALAAAPAGALTTATTGSSWGCAGIELVGGLCLDNPFDLLGLTAP